MGKKNKNKDEELSDEYVIDNLIDTLNKAFPEVEFLLKDQDGKIIYEKTKEKQTA